ncbi:NAD-dependent epimerase/dehydratase family protein [Streptococcus sp. S784/96/1]|uniref:NAD-dependent epimerase/dehydratase family protein n=1 Tax=Streptococcus sp. S784/96/1 TaxID=2653499 RepID=UPI0013875928|nr:NAD-dependent epimerase/dehydratase family protein [Streptococcus sp. S784/96/1]
MKALFIGGTGVISTAVVERLAKDPLWEIWVLNRGNRENELPTNVHQIIADINDEQDVALKILDFEFDTVCQFIAFSVEDVERDYRLFKNKTKQYIYISSASVYHKPVPHYCITEGTTLANPYWQYSRNKIASEEFLMNKYRTEGFPVTIVRPGHTYSERYIPLGVRGKNGVWQIVKRMLEGKPVIIHGDGMSIWPMTFSSDFATGFCGLMGNPKAIGEDFHVTGDEILTWNQIYQTVADALGVSLKAYHISSEFLSATGDHLGYDFNGSLLGDKAASVIYDTTKLKRIVPEMKTLVPFHKGIRIAVEYVLSHPEECQKEDPEFDKWCDDLISELEIAKENMRKWQR